ELRLPVRVHGDAISVDANVMTRRGDFVRVPLGIAAGTTTLQGRVPVGAKLIALTFGVTNSGLHGAANGRTGAQSVDRGTLADGAALTTALDADSPGSAVTNEVWVSTHDPSALGRPPFKVLTLQTHSQVERALQSEPLARGSLFVLAGASAVALALALLGILLGL